MIVLYKDGKTCKADLAQVEQMVKAGWKKEAPKAESKKEPEKKEPEKK